MSGGLAMVGKEAWAFWALVSGRSHQRGADVAAVLRGWRGEGLREQALGLWRDGALVLPVAVAGNVEAIILASSEDEALLVAAAAAEALRRSFPAISGRPLLRTADGFAL